MRSPPDAGISAPGQFWGSLEGTSPGLGGFRGILFKGFACLTRVQLPEKSAGFQYRVWAHVLAGHVTWLIESRV